MKYPNTKRDRNNAIVHLRQANPDMPLREIADMFEISTARVSAIIKRAKDRKKNS